MPEMVKLTAAGITMEVDLMEILTAIDPHGNWLGYDPERDEDVSEPSSLEIKLIDATAALLVKALRKEVKDAVLVATRESIKIQVAEIVRMVLQGDVQQVSEWGSPSGEAKPLRDLIGEEAQKALRKPARRDGYGGGRSLSMVQEIIQEEISVAFKKELADTVEQARKETLAAVRDQAAQVIAEAVRRATPGL